MPVKKEQNCIECFELFLGPEKQRCCSRACAKEFRKKQVKEIACKFCGKYVSVNVNASIVKCGTCKTARASGRGGNSYKVPSRVQLSTGGLCDWVSLKTDRSRKKWILLKYGYFCWICKNSSWMEKSIPLELDHIDGNVDNTNEVNFRILCPNCHAQTSTYKAKNKGHGAKCRQKMYDSMRLRASLDIKKNL